MYYYGNHMQAYQNTQTQTNNHENGGYSYESNSQIAHNPALATDNIHGHSTHPNYLQQPYQPNYSNPTYLNNVPPTESHYAAPPANFGDHDNYYRPSMGGEERKKNASDTMPHPIDVNYKDYEKYYGQTFDTSDMELMPPQISTTNVFFTGFRNCSPHFMRSTLYGIPNTYDLLKNSGIPFGIIVTPFSENDSVTFSLVDHGPDGPVRCRRCRAYVNPYVQFINGGKNYRCNLCCCVNDVPDSYFCNLDQSGTRLDYSNRPELIYGTYDFVTNANYCRNSIVKASPFLIFMIDVTYTAICSGMVKQVTSTLANLIKEGIFDSYCGESGLRIGIIAYDIRMYVFCPNNENEPHMEVICDMEDPFISSLHSFVVDPSLNKKAIIDLLIRIPEIFQYNKQIDIMLGPVITAALEMIKPTNSSSKIYVFHSSLPTFEVQGQLKHSEDRTSLGTEDEKKVLAPQNNYYSQLGDKCVEQGIGIDLYLFPTGPIEVASLAPLCTKTGGNLKLYKYFKSATSGSCFSSDFGQSLKSYTGLDTMAKLRCSNGLSVKNIYGNLTVVNESEVLMSAVDSGKSICFEITHDDKVSDVVYFQFAILHTKYSGERWIRVHNLGLKVVSSIVEMFKRVDCDAVSHYLLKYACRYFLDNGLGVTRQQTIAMLVKILLSYRKNCASTPSPLQLILPENLKLLPLYVNTIINHDCINGGKELVPDDKCFALFSALSANFNDTNILFYSRVFDVLTMVQTRELNTYCDGYSCEYCLPNGIVQVRASYERLNSSRLYLLENGTSIFLWFGKSVIPTIYSDLFGANAHDQYVGVVVDHLPAIDSELSMRLASLVAEIRKLRQKHMRIYICQQDNKSEYFFRKSLSEDKAFSNNSTSYVEFLCLCHQEIRKLLND